NQAGVGVDGTPILGGDEVDERPGGAQIFQLHYELAHDVAMDTSERLPQLLGMPSLPGAHEPRVVSELVLFLVGWTPRHDAAPVFCRATSTLAWRQVCEGTSANKLSPSPTMCPRLSAARATLALIRIVLTPSSSSQD